MSDVVGMYNNACAFYDCAKSCLKNSEKGNSVSSFLLHTPSIVNCAFACELFMKMLVEFFGGEYRKVHDLYKLFERLPEEEQGRIYGKLACLTELKDAFGMDLLKKSAESFNKWRYSFESDHLVAHVGFLFSLCEVLKEEAYKQLSIQ